MIVIERKITMILWSRDYINRIESDLRKRIKEPRNTKIYFNVVGHISEIQMKTLAFMQLNLTGFAYLPDSKQWDCVEKWVIDCPIFEGVERYTTKEG